MQSELLKKSTSDDELDLIFKALSDRTRREQLRLLIKGPASVSELASRFDMTLAAASKHLSVLEKAGLLIRNKNGRVYTCTFSPETLIHVNDWLASYKIFWNDSLESLANIIEQDSE